MMIVRCWYSICVWYLCCVVRNIERKQAKLEVEALHSAAQQKMMHNQQVERLRISVSHERERLSAKRAHMREYALLLMDIKEPLSVQDTRSYVDIIEIVDHEILGQDPEGILPSKY